MRLMLKSRRISKTTKSFLRKEQKQEAEAELEETDLEQEAGKR